MLFCLWNGKKTIFVLIFIDAVLMASDCRLEESLFYTVVKSIGRVVYYEEKEDRG